LELLLKIPDGLEVVVPGLAAPLVLADPVIAIVTLVLLLPPH
jgi:hypothetical protein